jgi:hypothetical protein
MRTRAPRGSVTVRMKTPPALVRADPPIGRHPAPTERCSMYLRRPEPGRTWPQSTTLDRLRDTCASGSANA